MTLPESRIDPAHEDARESDSMLDALWRQQERAHKAVVVGADASTLDRGLFKSLANEALPTLPEDFAMNAAIAAQRHADARRRVARFRVLSLRLFSLLYLPAITAAFLAFGADVPMLWAQQTPEQRAPLMWAGVLALLWSIGVLVDRLRSRDGFPFARH